MGIFIWIFVVLSGVYSVAYGKGREKLLALVPLGVMLVFDILQVALVASILGFGSLGRQVPGQSPVVFVSSTIGTIAVLLSCGWTAKSINDRKVKRTMDAIDGADRRPS